MSVARAYHLPMMRRHEFGEAAKRAAISTLRRLPASSNRSRRCVVLCYHSVDPHLPFASADPELFDRHLEWLRGACNVVRLDDVYECATNGSDDSDGRPVVAITFDDGYEDNFVHAYPRLRALEVPATFFVTVGLVEADASVVARLEALRDGSVVRGMNWEQLRELHDAGFAVSSHTYSHPNLARLDRAAATREITRAKEILEERLQVADRCFAYPFGKPGHHFTDETMDVLRSAGYGVAVSVVFRGVQASDDPLAVPRFFVRGDDVKTLEEKVRGAWDRIGRVQARLPASLARAVFPADFAHGNEGVQPG